MGKIQMSLQKNAKIDMSLYYSVYTLLIRYHWEASSNYWALGFSRIKSGLNFSMFSLFEYKPLLLFTYLFAAKLSL